MSLEHSMPEGFLGAVAGFEGVSDGYTAIHGPTGCKFYPSSAAEDYFVHSGFKLPRSRNPLVMKSLNFFGQPRVPCTYLDMDAFVSGASARLEDLISQLESLKPSVISVINSPGASLVGEDLTRISAEGIPVVAMDHSEYSGTIENGYQDAVLAILEKIKPEHVERNDGINLVGISISHLRWKDTVDDLTALLEVCGVTVNRTVGAGWSVDDIRRSADASLNVCIYPEYGDRICRFYEEGYGIPSVICKEGAPIGYTALESWIFEVCSRLGKDPSPALGIIRARRTRTADILVTMEGRHSLPRGRTFSVQCGGSTAYAVTRFLHTYLGMIPVAVKCTSGKEWSESLDDYLESVGIPVSDEPEDTPADIIISTGPVCSAAVERGIALEYAVVEYPSPVAVVIDPMPPVGLKGTISLLESVLDTVMRHRRFH